MLTERIAWTQLRDEIDQAIKERGSDKMLSYQDTQKLPYLQACIKEGLRMHPATGLPLVRVVPEGGARIAGRYFPAKVRVNALGFDTSFAIRNRSTTKRNEKRLHNGLT